MGNLYPLVKIDLSHNYKLEVNGDAAKSSGGTTWSVSSDARLKDISGEYARGLDAVARLRPVTFFYKRSNARGLPTDEENIGFIAQEVQEVFPEAVIEGPDGYLDFNMHPVNVALVNAVKQLESPKFSRHAGLDPRKYGIFDRHPEHLTYQKDTGFRLSPE